MVTVSGGWRRSSWCSTNSCAEVSLFEDGHPGCAAVTVRNSRRPDREVRFTPGEWEAFIAGVKAGEFTLDALRRERE